MRPEQLGRGFWLELYAGDTLLGGARYGNTVASKTQPTPPAGHAFCRYRFPSEQIVVDQGATLRMTLEKKEDGGKTPYPIGTSEEAPSILRIPFFTPAQASYRFPEIIPREMPARADPAPAATSILGVAGISAAALAPMLGRRRSVPLVLLLAMASTSLAGCVLKPSSTSPSPVVGEGDPTVSVEFRDPGGTGLANQSFGSIVGRVSDLYGYAVARAHVAVLGTDRSAMTDSTGVFSVEGLRPGSYRLRIDAEYFASLESEVTVRANKVSQVDIRLSYDASLASGARPHRHDYWAGENTSVVFKSEIQPSCSVRECFAAELFGIPPDGSPDRNIIRPGTVEVEVVLDFDPEETGGNLALLYQDNADPHPNNWSFLVPRGPGEPFHIRTTWETTDVGHQLFSTWAFKIVGQLSTTVPWSNVHVQQVTMTIHRGSVPLEPAHPEHWKGARSLQVAKDMAWKDADTYPFFTELLGDTCYGAWPYLGGAAWPVPVGTSSATLFVNQSRSNGPKGQQTWTWDLYYKSGESPPEPYRVGSPVYKKAATTSPTDEGRRWAWTFQVEDKEADGLYNKKSAWRFALVPSDPRMRCLDAFRLGEMTLSLTWDMVVQRAADA